MKTLLLLPKKSKNIILRLDWNVPMQESKILDDSRILETFPTVRRLLKEGHHITIISHLGRPKEVNSKDSLFFLCEAVSTLLGENIHFIQNLDELGKQWGRPVSLLENLRFWPEEMSDDAVFAKQLCIGADAFVNDAFSVSHRKHTSVSAIAKILPSYAGLLMEKEIASLNQFLRSPNRPITVICGGAKVSTKINFIQNFIKKADKIALVGAIANTFLKAQGYEVGLSLIEQSSLDVAKEILKGWGGKIWLPEYVMVGKDLDDAPRCCKVDNVQKDERILDMALTSVDELLDICATSKTVIWNGALGLLEDPAWAEGSIQFAKGLAGLTNVDTLAGGGETVLALQQADVLDQLSYVSMAGGAFMEYMEGKELPGIIGLQ
jgi:phosphoglycerate kinase